MTVKFYKNDKFHFLAGTKVYHNGSWKIIPANAKIWLNEAWHKIGITAPVPPQNVPAQTITHDNGTEPSGTKWYISPNGSGTMDGASWVNAAPVNMIHAILLQCVDGDSIFFLEGTYITDRTMVLPDGVNLYGGFDAVNPQWSTRNGFNHQSVFIGNGNFSWAGKSSSLNYTVVDGFVAGEYTSLLQGRFNLRNSIISGMALGGTVSSIDHCILSSLGRGDTDVYSISYCNVFYTRVKFTVADHVNIYGTDAESVYGGRYDTSGTATDCNFVYATLQCATAVRCSVLHGNALINNADHVNVYGKSDNPGQTRLNQAVDCNVTNCTGFANISQVRRGTYIYNWKYISIFGSATNCNAVNCSCQQGEYDSSVDQTIVSIYSGAAVNCTAQNCNCILDKTAYGSIYFDSAENCKAVNCQCDFVGNVASLDYNTIYNGISQNCIAVNCSCHVAASPGSSSDDVHNSIFSDQATDCSAVNCSCIGYAGGSLTHFVLCVYKYTAINCNAVNCSLNNTTDNHYFAIYSYTAINCNAVNCSLLSPNVTNSFPNVFWNRNSSDGGKMQNCLSFNNNNIYDSFSPPTNRNITCADWKYTSSYSALTLGADNSIARFTNTGYYPAQGVQDVGDCPNPISDPTGYAAYLAAFGDWHPLANSFLVGRGTADSAVTTDADGVTRPDPPTIGAYEPVPVS